MRQRSALFVDCDNLYYFLSRYHSAQIAEAVLSDPKPLLSELERQGLDVFNAAVRRVYFSPKGPTAKACEQAFADLGFTLIAISDLGTSDKTSADIQITMDVLDALADAEGDTLFGLISFDSNFTPLLQRLREFGAERLVLSAPTMRSAYENSANRVLDCPEILKLYGFETIDNHAVGKGASSTLESQPEEPILERAAQQVLKAIGLQGALPAGRIPRLLTTFPEFRESEQAGLRWFGYKSLRDLAVRLTELEPQLCLVEPQHDPQSWSLATDGTTTAPSKQKQVFRNHIMSCIEEIVAEAKQPLPLSKLGLEIGKRMGSEPKNSEWAGAGSLSILVKQSQSSHLSVSETGQGYIFDHKRHGQEDVDKLELPDAKAYDQELQSFIDEVSSLTGMPALGPNEYFGMFDAIRHHIEEAGFPGILNLSRMVRDTCRDRGLRVARTHVNFLLNQLTASRYFLDNESAQLEPLSDAVLERTLTLLTKANRSLSDEEDELLEIMLGFDLITES